MKGEKMPTGPVVETNAGFDNLLDFLKRSRNLSFHGYKRTGLMRRVQKRMEAVKVATYEEYQDHLEVHPNEFTDLFNTLLINVTSFFRDEATWNYLASQILPEILANKAPSGPIRVWSAGCAAGQEAYSLAILLAEALGREACQRRVKIYATDIDADVLTQARQASYDATLLENVPARWRSKYFIASGSRYVFREDLRRPVIFGRHDLIQDAPISRLDLLVCRNTLMYFNTETQSKILSRFHFALNEHGCLFLGKAEMVLNQGAAFSPKELKHRFFIKNASHKPRDRVVEFGALNGAPEGGAPERPLAVGDAVFNAGPQAQVVLDPQGKLLRANELARALWGLSPKDVGRRWHELAFADRLAKLRPLLTQAYAEKRLVRLEVDAEPRAEGLRQHLEVGIQPLYGENNEVLGALLTFADTTIMQQLRAEAQETHQALETANQELQATQEELETTNEELQSTNEELETTNEELQSTNEELETMNEELQSTNEELEASNGELQQRTSELKTSNAFLCSILACMPAGVVVVDRQLKVMIWNQRNEDLWGVRTEEAQGKPLASLDIGLPVAKLPLAAFLAGKEGCQETTLEATNRRGKAIKCRVTCTPFIGTSDEREGVVLLVEELL
jgi:two-component system CheB/CheR fusion protein